MSAANRTKKQRKEAAKQYGVNDISNVIGSNPTLLPYLEGKVLMAVTPDQLKTLIATHPKDGVKIVREFYRKQLQVLNKNIKEQHKAIVKARSVLKRQPKGTKTAQVQTAGGSVTIDRKDLAREEKAFNGLVDSSREIMRNALAVRRRVAGRRGFGNPVRANPQFVAFARANRGTFGVVLRGDRPTGRGGRGGKTSKKAQDAEKNAREDLEVSNQAPLAGTFTSIGNGVFASSQGGAEGRGVPLLDALPLLTRDGVTSAGVVGALLRLYAKNKLARIENGKILYNWNQDQDPSTSIARFFPAAEIASLYSQSLQKKVGKQYKFANGTSRRLEANDIPGIVSAFDPTRIGSRQLIALQQLLTGSNSAVISTPGADGKKVRNTQYDDALNKEVRIASMTLNGWNQFQEAQPSSIWAQKNQAQKSGRKGRSRSQ
jgi:hypothetical protein